MPALLFNNVLSDESLLVPQPNLTAVLVRFSVALTCQGHNKLEHLVLALGEADADELIRVALRTSQNSFSLKSDHVINYAKRLSCLLTNS